MDIARLPDHIHLIPLPTPFSVGDVNVVLLEGDPLTLVDTGPVWDQSRTVLVRELAARGYTPSDLDLVLLTHRHCDHIGLAPWLEEQGATVLAHGEAMSWLKEGVHHTGRIPFFQQLMIRAGAPPTLGDGAIEHDRWAYVGINPVRRPHAVHEGQVLRLGSTDWRVYATPGHCHTQLFLVEERTGIALGGDHLLAHISSNAIIDVIEPFTVEPLRPLSAYRTSLDRVAALDLSTVLTGHGATVQHHRQLIGRRQVKTDERLRSVLRRVSPEGSTTHEVMRKLFGHLPDQQFFFGISEVLGHLFILEDRGELTRLTDGREDRWIPTTRSENHL